jgi:hypothetical protein
MLTDSSRGQNRGRSESVRKAARSPKGRLPLLLCHLPAGSADSHIGVGKAARRLQGLLPCLLTIADVRAVAGAHGSTSKHEKGRSTQASMRKAA